MRITCVHPLRAWPSLVWKSKAWKLIENCQIFPAFCNSVWLNKSFEKPFCILETLSKFLKTIEHVLECKGNGRQSVRGQIFYSVLYWTIITERLKFLSSYWTRDGNRFSGVLKLTQTKTIQGSIVSGMVRLRTFFLFWTFIHTLAFVLNKGCHLWYPELNFLFLGLTFPFWKSRKDLWLLVSVMTIKSFRCLLLTWHNKNYFLILDLCLVGTRSPLVMSFLQLSSRIIRTSIEFVLNLLC